MPSNIPQIPTITGRRGSIKAPLRGPGLWNPSSVFREPHSRNHDQGAHKETTLLETLGNLEQAGGCFKSESLGNTFPVPGYFGLFQYRRRLSLNPKPYIDVCWVFGVWGFHGLCLGFGVYGSGVFELEFEVLAL